MSHFARHLSAISQRGRCVNKLRLVVVQALYKCFVICCALTRSRTELNTRKGKNSPPNLGGLQIHAILRRFSAFDLAISAGKPHLTSSATIFASAFSLFSFALFSLVVRASKCFCHLVALLSRCLFSRNNCTKIVI